jgi:hypothetical protein
MEKTKIINKFLEGNPMSYLEYSFIFNGYMNKNISEK